MTSAMWSHGPFCLFVVVATGASCPGPGRMGLLHTSWVLVLSHALMQSSNS